MIVVINGRRKMPRKTKNWIEAFNAWSLPRSESPETFHTFGAYFALSAIIKRKTKITKKLLGRYDVYPTLYIMFIGPAGGPRKSTSMDDAMEILDEFPTITKAADAPSKEILIKRIADSPDSSVVIPSSEFGQFIMKSGYEMYEVLTNLFDNRKTLSQDTFARSLELAKDPCGVLLGCTTPDWIAENMPESVVGGGFASRVIFVFEESVRKRRLFYDDQDLDFASLKKDLVADAFDIANNCAGEFAFSKEGKEYLRDWYESGKYRAKHQVTGNTRLDGYFNRKHIHAMKLAMIQSIAESNKLILELHHIQKGIEDLEEAEKKLPQTFKHIGKNEYVTDVDRIKDYIIANGKVERKQLIREFIHVAAPEKLAELIGSVVIVYEKDIQVTRDSDKVYYEKRAI